MFKKLIDNKIKKDIAVVDIPYGGKRYYRYLNDSMGQLILEIEEKVELDFKLFGLFKKRHESTVSLKQLKMPRLNYKQMIALKNGKDFKEPINEVLRVINIRNKENKDEDKKHMLNSEKMYINHTYKRFDEKTEKELVDTFGLDTKIMSYDGSSRGSVIGVYSLVEDFKDAELVRVTQVYTVKLDNRLVIGETHTYDIDYEFLERLENEE